MTSGSPRLPPLKGISAVQLVTILRPLVPLSGQINALSERNAVIICGRTANVRPVVETIKILERLPPLAGSTPGTVDGNN